MSNGIRRLSGSFAGRLGCGYKGFWKKSYSRPSCIQRSKHTVLIGLYTHLRNKTDRAAVTLGPWRLSRARPVAVAPQTATAVGPALCTLATAAAATAPLSCMCLVYFLTHASRAPVV